MLKHLRLKLVCINMALVTIMLCIIFFLVLHFTQENLEDQSITMMQAIASDPMQPGHPANLPDRIRTPYFALQLNGREELLVSGDEYYDLSDREFLLELLNTSISTGKQTGLIREYDLRYYRAPSPVGMLVIFADASHEIDTMKGLVKTCLFIGALSFLAFLGLSFVLAQWAVRPVAKAWEQQRQFVADASHELKTPLTVITTNAELLQSPDCPPTQQAQFSSSILAMSRQMRGLVEGLLELARVDNGAVRTAFSRVDLSQLAQETVLPFDAVFFEAELTLSTAIESNILLKGSPAHLRQVMEILLDNARKYSHPRTEVLLRLYRSGRTSCLLAVSNLGEPISPQDLKNIFKRFYRADQARAMNQSYGLGLSIAEGIVQGHGGKIWAESTGGVNTFFVQLPTL